MSHRIKQFFTGLALGALSWSLPKKRGTVVFYPIHEKRRFSGNLRYLALYMAEHHPELELVWLTPDENTAKIVREAGLRPHVFRSLPLRILAEAEIVVIDSYVKYLMFGNFNIVQVWHGAGYKKIGASNPSNGRWFKRVMLKLQHRQLRMVVAQSDEDVRQKREIFDTDRVCLTGSPRNDVFFQDAQDIWVERRRLGISDDARVVLYAPTYRESTTDVVLGDDFWRELQRCAEVNGFVFLVKKHPLDVGLSVPVGCSNVRDVSALLDDIQAGLLLSDVLVTDYSSVATDFSIVDRSIIFFTYDAAAYRMTCRALYYDLFDILPGPFASTSAELCSLLSDLSWKNDPRYVAKFQAFRSFFNSYFDGGASKRVCGRIISIMNSIDSGASSASHSV